MRRLIEAAFSVVQGFSYMIEDDLISFYTFITTIFAEGAYLWAFHSSSIAIPFSIILMGYIINVIVMGCLKEKWGGTKKEILISVLYLAIAAILFVVGCFFNIIASSVLIAVALVVTLLNIVIRNEQDSIFFAFGNSKREKLKLAINSIFRNPVIYVISQIIVIGAPYVLFVVFFAMIPIVPIILKIIVPIVYLIFMPYVSYLEDECGTNIFGIAFDIGWSKEKEEWLKTRNDMHEKVIEVNGEEKHDSIIRRSCTDEIGTTYCASSIQVYEDED